MKKQNYTAALITGVLVTSFSVIQPWTEVRAADEAPANPSPRHALRPLGRAQAPAALAAPVTTTAPQRHRMPGEVESPFQACANVPILQRNVFDALPRNGGTGDCADCRRFQREMESGLFVTSIDGIDNAQQSSMAKEFLKGLATRYQQNTQRNLDNLTQQQRCFSKHPTVAAAQADPECRQVVDDMVKTLREVAPQMRQELALSRSHDLGDSIGFSTDANQANQVNAELRSPTTWSLGWTNNNPFEGLRLTPAELERARTAAREEQEKMMAEARETQAEADQMRQRTQQAVETTHRRTGRVMTTASTSEGDLQGAYRNLRNRRRDEHRESYRQLVLSRAPIFYYLKPAAEQDANGVPQFTMQQLAEATGRLVANARTELQKTNDSIRRGNFEFRRLVGTRTETGTAHNWFTGENTEFTRERVDLFQRFFQAFVSGERDLSDYMAFKPLIEDVLKENPEFCGVATGLASHQGYKELQNMGLTIGALVVGTGGAGVGLALASSGGAAVGGVATGAIGLATGAGMTVQAGMEVNRVAGALAARSGSGDESGPMMEARALAEVENNFRMQAAGHVMLDYALSGGAARLMYEAGKRAILGSELAGQIGRLSSGSARAEVTAVRSALNRRFAGESNEAIARQNIDKLVNDVFENRFAAATDQQIRNMEKLVTEAIGFNVAATPAQVRAASATSTILSRTKLETLGWQPESFDAFKRVVRLLNDDLAKKTEHDIAEILQNPAKQQDAIAAVLQREGVSPEESQFMAGCTMRPTAAR